MIAKTVWETLSKIDVGSHVEKKGNLSYLSWAWAWATLMEHFPASSYDFLDPIREEDGTVTVWVMLNVSDGTEQICRMMWLPVMDNRNNAIVAPTARQISDTRMRCLVKAMAMCGLGHYIYAGEDLPPSEPKSYDAEIQAIRECESLADLKRIWDGLDSGALHACEQAKDEAKARLAA